MKLQSFICRFMPAFIFMTGIFDANAQCDWALSSPCTANVKNLVTDFGAVPNDGNDDYAALKAAAAFFKDKRNVRLEIPTGTYHIRKRVATGYGLASCTVPDAAEDIVYDNVENLEIKSIGGVAEIVVDNNYIITDNCVSLAGGYYYSGIRGVIPFRFTGCRNVYMHDISLKGGNEQISVASAPVKALLAEVPNYGVLVQDNIVTTGPENNPRFATVDQSRRFRFENLSFSHFATDGIQIDAMNGTDFCLKNVVSEYNSRMGLGITAGHNFYIENCRFNYNGKNTGTYKAHAPAAGIDVESSYYKANRISEVTVKNCEMKYNTGFQFVTTNAYFMEISDCLFADDFNGGGTGNPYSGGLNNSIALGSSDIKFHDNVLYCPLYLEVNDVIPQYNEDCNGRGRNLKVYDNTIITNTYFALLTIQQQVNLDNNLFIQKPTPANFYYTPGGDSYFPHLVGNHADTRISNNIFVYDKNWIDGLNAQNYYSGVLAYSKRYNNYHFNDVRPSGSVSNPTHNFFYDGGNGWGQCEHFNVYMHNTYPNSQWYTSSAPFFYHNWTDNIIADVYGLTNIAAASINTYNGNYAALVTSVKSVRDQVRTKIGFSYQLDCSCAAPPAGSDCGSVVGRTSSSAAVSEEPPKKQRFEVQVMPNPASGSMVEVRVFNANQELHVSINLLSTEGKTVFSKILPPGKSSLPVPAGLLQSGVYLIKAVNGTAIASAKLVVP